MPWFAPTYNAAPQSTQPVVRLNRDTGAREVALMRWGLVPFWAKDAKIGYTTINARAEEAPAKPMYREAFKKRRCLIPADAFYEWDRIDPIKGITFFCLIFINSNKITLNDLAI